MAALAAHLAGPYALGGLLGLAMSDTEYRLKAVGDDLRLMDPAVSIGSSNGLVAANSVSDSSSAGVFISL